jgi:hypothetical protein
LNGKYLAVDRIEGEFAVCYDDDNQKYDIPLCDVDLPEDISEGDILKLDEDGRLGLDGEEKKRRQQANLDLLRRLMGKG